MHSTKSGIQIIPAQRWTEKRPNWKGAIEREYIFLRLDKVCPWEGMDMKADFSFREKVSLSEIVGKKDRLSNRAELWKGKESGSECTVSFPGIHPV